jgi:hypothetical protein
LGEFSPFGRLFTLGSFLRNDKGNPNFRATFFLGRSYVLFFYKNRFGYSVVIFSLTHLVTLFVVHHLVKQEDRRVAMASYLSIA